MNKKNNGYTLVELLLCLAIFSVVVCGIIAMMRSASVSYKNESFDVTIQKDAQIFLSQVEDIVVDTKSKIAFQDYPDYYEYKIDSTKGTCWIKFVPSENKVYYKDISSSNYYLMAERVDSFVIKDIQDTSVNNSCIIDAKFDMGDNSTSRTYDISKEVYFRNNVENSSNYVLDLSVSSSGGSGGGSNQVKRVVDRYEIVNVKNEYGIVNLTSVGNGYSALKVDSTHYNVSVDDLIGTPEYVTAANLLAAGSFLVTTSADTNKNCSSSISDTKISGTNAAGETIDVYFSTPSVQLKEGSGVVEYPASNVNNSYVTYMPLEGYDIADYNKYWKSSIGVSVTCTFEFLDNGVNILESKYENKPLVNYSDCFSGNFTYGTRFTNHFYQNQSGKMSILADDIDNDNIILAYDNAGSGLYTPYNPYYNPPASQQHDDAYDDGKASISVDLSFPTGDGTNVYNAAATKKTYKVVTTGTDLTNM